MKVGFIDYNLNNYHATKFHGILTGVPQYTGALKPLLTDDQSRPRR